MLFFLLSCSALFSVAYSLTTGPTAGPTVMPTAGPTLIGGSGGQYYNPQIIGNDVTKAMAAVAIDMNGDGYPDVVSAYWDGFVWFRNNNDGSFTKNIIDSSAQSGMSVIAVDLDNDGDIDVAGVSSDDHGIQWYENDGLMGFTKHSLSPINRPKKIAYVDMDGDGDLDLLAGWGSNGGGGVGWFENDGAGGFTKHIIMDGLGQVMDVVGVDMDGDGDVDVVMVDEKGKKVYYFENDGSQQFIASSLASSGDGLVAIAVVDMDGDGDYDIALGSTGILRWLRNNGDGSFTSSPVDSLSLNCRDVVALDYDSDGDVDLLVTSYINNKIYLYENDGSMSFSRFPLTGFTVNDCRSIYVTDFNGDSFLDIVISERGGNSVSVLEGTAIPTASPTQLAVAQYTVKFRLRRISLDDFLANDGALVQAMKVTMAEVLNIHANRVQKMLILTEVNRHGGHMGVISLNVYLRTITADFTVLGPADTYALLLLQALADGTFWSTFSTQAAVFGGSIPVVAEVLGNVKTALVSE